MAAILKFKMAAKKRKFQPGKLPTTILEAPRNILVPFASFYSKCLADLILGPNLDSAPWLCHTIHFTAEFGDVKLLWSQETPINHSLLHPFLYSDLCPSLFFRIKNECDYVHSLSVYSLPVLAFWPRAASVPWMGHGLASTSQELVHFWPRPCTRWFLASLTSLRGSHSHTFWHATLMAGARAICWTETWRHVQGVSAVTACLRSWLQEFSCVCVVSLVLATCCIVSSLAWLSCLPVQLTMMILHATTSWRRLSVVCVIFTVLTLVSAADSKWQCHTSLDYCTDLPNTSPISVRCCRAYVTDKDETRPGVPEYRCETGRRTPYM